MSNRQPPIKDITPIESSHSRDIVGRDVVYSTGYTVDEVKKLLSEINKTLKSPNATIEVQNANGSELTEHSAEIIPENVLRALKNAENMLRNIAGIELPEHRNELYVKATTIYQLQEYQQDENIFLSLTSLSAGAALGVLVNWATSDSANLNQSGWVALILFGIVTLLFIALWQRIKKRINETKKGIGLDKPHT